MPKHRDQRTRLPCVQDGSTHVGSANVHSNAIHCPNVALEETTKRNGRFAILWLWIRFILSLTNIGVAFFNSKLERNKERSCNSGSHSSLFIIAALVPSITIFCL